MEIDKKVAERIVFNLKDVLDQDINFIDSEGIIIASTNPTRVDTHHSAAPMVFKEGKKIIVTSDDEDENTKEGVNMPVYFEGEIIGAIGITGKVDDVLKYDEVIRAMTESFIYQSLLKTQNKLKSDMKRQVFKQLLMYPETDLNTMVGKSRVVDLKIENYDRVIVCKYLSENGSDAFERQMDMDNIYKKFKYIFKSKIPVQTTYADDMFIVLSPKVSDDILDIMVKEILEELDNKNIYIGIGNQVSSFKRLKYSYNNAVQAVNIIMKSYTDKNHVFYRKLDVELLLTDVTEGKKEEFIKHVFSGISKKNLEQFVETLEMYFKYNGSINETADELYIHKNTLQYRLNKIKEKTGYNPRVLNDGYVLNMAVKIYNDIQEKNRQNNT